MRTRNNEIKCRLSKQNNICFQLHDSEGVLCCLVNLQSKPKTLFLIIFGSVTSLRPLLFVVGWSVGPSVIISNKRVEIKRDLYYLWAFLPFSNILWEHLFKRHIPCSLSQIFTHKLNRCRQSCQKKPKYSFWRAQKLKL